MSTATKLHGESGAAFALLAKHFPQTRYARMLPNQEAALQTLADRGLRSTTLELPTGSGKTAIGYTYLRALASERVGSYVYVVPTKALVDQVRLLHPDMEVVYGRSEYECLYYDDGTTADQVPCATLCAAGCPHDVDPETGETADPDAEPCPYKRAKFDARKGGEKGKIVVTTMAFYLFNQLFQRTFGEDGPAGLVVDEAHRLADLVRGMLTYKITDQSLLRAVAVLLRVGAAEEAKALRRFVATMRLIIKKRKNKTPLLEVAEIEKLIEALEVIEQRKVMRRLAQAVKSGEISATDERETLREVELVLRDVYHYLHTLSFALPGEERKNPLNFVYCYYEKERIEDAEGKFKVHYRLFIRSYYVAGLIKTILSSRTLAYSATIGDPKIFGYESGITASCYELGSEFPPENTRIFLPADAPDLSSRGQKRGTKARAIRRIAQTAKTFAKKGHRSLVVVMSNEEKEQFLLCAEEEGVRAVSYGNGTTARAAALAFKEGEGEVLVGTAAHFGEGIDLPKGVAPVIFFLRPGFPPPNDPQALFEEKRFGAGRWQIWNWRVVTQALQARGRNVRSADDLGVTFFVSSQFRRFVPGALPKWLSPALRGKLTWDQCVKDALGLLE